MDFDFEDDISFDVEDIIEKYEKAKFNFRLAEICLSLFTFEYIKSLIRVFCIEYLNIFSQPYIEQQSDEWYRIRNFETILTASEIGTVLGHNHFPGESFENLFLIKTKQIPPKPKNEATIHGNKNEDVAAKEFADKHGFVLFNMSILKWEKDPRIGVSCDRVGFKCDENKIYTDELFNVEIKTPLSRVVTLDEDEEYVKEQFPYYYDQMQLQMMVTGLKKTKFVRLGMEPNPYHVNKRIMSVVDIPYNEKWWDESKDLIYEFIDKVELYRKNHPNWSKKTFTEQESVDFWNNKPKKPKQTKKPHSDVFRRPIPLFKSIKK